MTRHAEFSYHCDPSDRDAQGRPRLRVIDVRFPRIDGYSLAVDVHQCAVAVFYGAHIVLSKEVLSSDLAVNVKGWTGDEGLEELNGCVGDPDWTAENEGGKRGLGE